MKHLVFSLESGVVLDGPLAGIARVDVERISHGELRLTFFDFEGVVFNAAQLAALGRRRKGMRVAGPTGFGSHTMGNPYRPRRQRPPRVVKPSRHREGFDDA